MLTPLFTRANLPPSSTEGLDDADVAARVGLLNEWPSVGVLTTKQSRWNDAGYVLTLRTDIGDRYPLFQFKDGSLHPTVSGVVARFTGKKDHWETAIWLTTPCAAIDGDRPSNRLDDQEAVYEAAKAEAGD